ncbi:hypothetical protein LSTR_LSTR011831 [Laodelphax striatellus]|uniref:Uncharacterized protein n=1 Tax=Laodelphax striatellus TaxID=195883 RepID=A0A482WW46_LAOST|nr:hypothetical protein LSTR_LSTR011831 [Laodelphax striatellus]
MWSDSGGSGESGGYDGYYGDYGGYGDDDGGYKSRKVVSCKRCGGYQVQRAKDNIPSQLGIRLFWNSQADKNPPTQTLNSWLSAQIFDFQSFSASLCQI